MPDKFKVTVTSRIDNLTVMDATLMKGESAECPLDRAKFLLGRGLIEPYGDDAPKKHAKGDVTTRATAPAASHAEHQTKKG